VGGDALASLTDDDERRRHTAECKYWLSVTRGKKAAVDELLLRIASKRGKAAADKLRDGMRDEWKREKDKKNENI